jgi:hypothetical protein
VFGWVKRAVGEINIPNTKKGSISYPFLLADAGTLFAGSDLRVVTWRLVQSWLRVLVVIELL